MKAVRKFLTFGLISAIATLAGCGGSEPSKDEVQAMFDKEAQSITQAAGAKGSMSNMAPKVSVNEIKGCEQVRDNVFRCTLDVTTTMLGRQINKVAAIQMSQSSDGGWVVVK